MKRLFHSSLCLLAVMLLATPLCLGQQLYTNSQQNFSVNVPGPVDESASTSDVYMLKSYNPGQTLALMVLSYNKPVSDTRDTLDSDVSDLQHSEGAFNCKDTVYHGDFAAICDMTQTNANNVVVHGKIWVCIHNNYEYTVIVCAADDSSSASQVMPYLDSFVFLK